MDPLKQLADVTASMNDLMSDLSKQSGATQALLIGIIRVMKSDPNALRIILSTIDDYEGGPGGSEHLKKSAELARFMVDEA